MLVPARTAATSFFDEAFTVARKWATGTIGTSPIDVVGDAVGSTSLGVGEGPAPEGGSAVSASVGAGVAVAIAMPPPAEGDGLPPKPSWPPETGNAMANASRPRTTSVGPRFTGRIVTEAVASGRRPYRAARRARPARGQENAPSGRADGA